MDYKKICDGLREITLGVGEYIAEQRKGFSFDKVEFKGAHNLVSYVDKQAETMLVGELGKLVPGSGFITEEGTVRYGGEKFKWVIDPLDGTTNFVHGLPPYCVSVALMEGEEVVVGAVYEITLREMFYAWKGSDAYMNGRLIKPSPVEKLENSIIAIGFSYSALEGVPGFMDKVAWLQRNTDGIRRLGSAAADIVYVAAGRMDTFWQINLAPWDVAAGALIAQRAGAVVTDMSGGGGFIFGKEIVVAAPGVYGQFMNVLGL